MRLKLNYKEVEALLKVLLDIEQEDKLNVTETSARDTLKRIYARQIAAHERKENGTNINSR